MFEPAETVEKDEDKKLIIYSMGNFLSNQRIETMQDEENAKWTERGVLMDVTIKKKQERLRLRLLKLILAGLIGHQKELILQKVIHSSFTKPIS